MRFITALCLFILSSFSTLHAQNDIFEFVGEDYYTVECAPWCNTFTLQLDSAYIIEELQVVVTPSTGVTITSSPNNILVYDICFDLPGFYTVVAFGEAFELYGNGMFVSDTVLVDIFDGYPVTGEIFGNTCQDSVARDECYQACEYSTVTYYFSGNANEGFWSVTGADSYQDNQTSVDVVWGAAGSGSVQFFPFLDCSSQEFVRCVDILATPEPAFNTLPAIDNGLVQLCNGQPLYLENLTQNATHYEWTFGDGTVSDLFEPEHSYNTPGIYTLTLTAFNSCDDCLESTSVQVEVLPAPAPELSCVATVCPDDKVRYVASTDGCQTYYWTVSGNGTVLSGGGTYDDFIEIEWGAGPDGFIELLVEDCNQAYCSKPVIFRIPIVSTDGPITGDQLVCSGEIASYKAPYFPGVTYNWSVLGGLGTIVSGQNTNAVSIQWAQVSSVQSNQTVEVSYGHCYLGCAGSDQHQVDIVPNMMIVSDAQFCEGHDGTFEASAGFTSQTAVLSSWRILDANGTEVYSSSADASQITIPLNYPPGEYTMIATPSNPNDVCEDYVEKDFIITPIPAIPLGIVGDSFICPGLTYTFEVENAGGYQTHWTITDGGAQSTYTGEIISHLFVNSPPYIVEAAHGDLVYPACISATISKTLLNSGEAEIIGADENCFEETSIYSVYDLPGNVLEWRVEPSDFAEVTNKNSQEASFYWTRDGNAQVILNVCGVDVVKNVLIHALPTPVVNHPAGLCKNEVAHVSTTIDYVSQVWKDTAGAVISMDSTTALVPGYYSVEVTDLNGCVGVTKFEIEFYPTPTARISTLGNTGHCTVVDPIELVANTDGTNYSFQWYHDGTEVGTDDPRYTAGDYGSYQVRITNQYGCSVFSNVITLFDWCDGSGGVCNGQTCNFYPCVEYGGLDYISGSVDCNTKWYKENSIDDVEMGSVNWDIEQPSGAYTRVSGDSVGFTYSDAGYYTVVLTAEIVGFPYTDTNCVHLIAFKDTVPLAARFDYHGACANAAIDFEDLSTFLPDYGITDWAWDFGDGGTSTAQHPSHTYTASGTFDVTLVVTSTSGCTSTFVGEVTVFDSPQISVLALAEACEDNPVFLNASSTQGLFDLVWDFDDATSANNDANSQLTFHTYETAGTYNPNVTASNIYSCSATASTSIEIFENNLAGDIVSSNGTPICEGDITDLISPAGGVKWNWNTEETTSQITIGDAGYYDVIIEDEHGCQYAPDPILIEVNPKPIATINGREVFGPGENGTWQDTVETCQGVDVELEAFASSSVSYFWSTTQTSQRISFTNEAGNLLSAGEHTFSVVVTDLATGCESEPAEIVVIVHENPDPFTISLVSGTGCSETPNVFRIDNPQANVTYVWSDGQEGTQIEATETGNYSAIGTNEFGCTTSSTNILVVRPSPRVDLFPSGCFTRCDPDTICIPSIPDISYFEILHDGVVVESGANLPDEYIATESGTYELYLESFNGCSAISAGLNLELFPGFGSIDVTVFVDVNENNIIDAGDTTISNVNVWLIENNALYNELLTNALGSAYFLNVPQGTYTAAIDTTNIPAGLIPIINNQIIDVIGCDLEFADSLLLGPCVIDVTIETMICPGDSIQIADSTFYPTGDFTYYYDAGGAGCDTFFFVDLIPPLDSGYINVRVFFDVNEDSLWTSDDSLITNIPIIITNTSTLASELLMTDVNGILNHKVESGTYIVELDTSFIINDWGIIIGRDTVTVTGDCGGGGDTTFINLLYGSNAPSTLLVSVDLDICPGDSVLVDGIYYKTDEVVEILTIDNGQETLTTYTISVVEDFVVSELIDEACEGMTNGTIEINASSDNGPVTIDWDHDPLASFSIGDLAPNTYQYTLSDAMCETNGEIILGEYIFPLLEIAETDPTCPGTAEGQIDVTLASPELMWSLDNVNFTTNSFTDLEAGEYTIYFSNGNCLQTETVTLEEKEIIPFEIESMIDVPVNTPIEITHNYLNSLTHTFNWDNSAFLSCDDCPGPIFTGSENDVRLFVIVTDVDGCEQEAELIIRADQSQHIYIPNAFSPNDDAINDRFKPLVREGVVQTERLEIFDRWGNMVYAEEPGSDDEIEGWDGTRYNNELTPGLFIYVAQFSYLNGEVKEVSGEIHLMR